MRRAAASVVSWLPHGLPLGATDDRAELGDEAGGGELATNALSCAAVPVGVAQPAMNRAAAARLASGAAAALRNGRMPLRRRPSSRGSVAWTPLARATRRPRRRRGGLATWRAARAGFRTRG